MPTEWVTPTDWATDDVITETKLDQISGDLRAVVRAGGAAGLTPTTTAAEIVSTASEMSMRTAAAAGNTTGWLIPAGLIGTDRLIKLIAMGDAVWNAANTLRLRIYLRDGVGGNTLLFDDTTSTPNLSASRQPWKMELDLAALASASSQLLTGTMLWPNMNAAAPASGIGVADVGASGYLYSIFADDAASAVDMSAARYLDATVTWGASSASLAWRLKYATLVVL